jgi:RHH-type transcriptional regulator, rel operon repressor / antitoxin RelB
MADTTLISVRVPAEIAKRLEQLAEALDRSKSYVAAQAIEEFLALQEWQVSAVRRGLQQAEKGKLHTHEQALERLGRWRRGGA